MQMICAAFPEKKDQMTAMMPLTPEWLEKGPGGLRQQAERVEMSALERGYAVQVFRLFFSDLIDIVLTFDYNIM